MLFLQSSITLHWFFSAKEQQMRNNKLLTKHANTAKKIRQQRKFVGVKLWTSIQKENIVTHINIKIFYYVCDASPLFLLFWASQIFWFARSIWRVAVRGVTLQERVGSHPWYVQVRSIRARTVGRSQDWTRWEWNLTLSVRPHRRAKGCPQRIRDITGPLQGILLNYILWWIKTNFKTTTFFSYTALLELLRIIVTNVICREIINK